MEPDCSGICWLWDRADRHTERTMLSPTTRLIVFATAFVASATAANPSANAASKFDGRWSAVLTTKSGPCNVAYRGAVQVINGIVQVEGAPNNVLTGRVSPNGSVTVRGSLTGNLYGTAWGRLSGNSGSGSWRVHLQNGECLGVGRRSGYLADLSKKKGTGTMAGPPIALAFSSLS